jgi:hypothetical protein
MLWLLFSFGFSASLGMSFFEGVGLPMQVGIIESRDTRLG